MPSVCGLRTIRVSSPKNVLLLSEFCDSYAHISALEPRWWSAAVLCLFTSWLLADTFTDGVREIQQLSASGRHEGRFSVLRFCSAPQFRSDK